MKYCVADLMPLILTRCLRPARNHKQRDWLTGLAGLVLGVFEPLATPFGLNWVTSKFSPT